MLAAGPSSSSHAKTLRAMVSSRLQAALPNWRCYLQLEVGSRRLNLPSAPPAPPPQLLSTRDNGDFRIVRRAPLTGALCLSVRPPYRPLGTSCAGPLTFTRRSPKSKM
jgi:hypothetical protein